MERMNCCEIKMRIRPIAPLAVLLVALLGACASASESLPPTDDAPATSAATAAVVPPVAPAAATPITGGTTTIIVPDESSTPRPVITGDLGERIESAGIALTVEAVTTEQDVEGLQRSPEGRTFLVVDVVIENAGDAPVMFNSYYFEIGDGDGQTYIPVQSVAAHSLKYGELEPGEAVEGKVAFEVPESASDLVSSYVSSDFPADFVPLRHRLD